MARSRMIKPEFWDDEKLSFVKRDARLLFIGMWNHSDDYAVVKGHPLWLKGKIFPYDSDITHDILSEWLSSLQKIGMIIPFNDNGEKFYYIRNFVKHQTINRPSQARNPEPPADILEILIECSWSAHGVLMDETETETEVQTETEINTLAAKQHGRKKRKVEYSPEFEKFWEIYPSRDGRKIGKKNAFLEFKKITQEDIPQLMIAVKHYLSEVDKPKDAERFIRQDVWLDFIEPPQKTTKPINRFNNSKIDDGDCSNEKFEKLLKGGVK